tara:strand:- start:544 stop:768 length:225 start_codon:yes stop_codon:yes gene_type:complete
MASSREARDAGRDAMRDAGRDGILDPGCEPPGPTFGTERMGSTTGASGSSLPASKTTARAHQRVGGRFWVYPTV